jgi:hypothetical protein
MPADASSENGESGGEIGFRRKARAFLRRLEQSRPVQGLLRFYERHEALTLALFFVGGVTYDALTLARIDAWFDNLFLLTYLALLGGLIVVSTLARNERLRRASLREYRAWYPLLIQFLLGTLFSAYVVYYSQSASLTGTLLFLGLLAVLLVANELVRWKIASLYLLLGLYFLATYSFLIFFIPVVTEEMSYRTFVGAGVVSVVLIAAMLGYLAWRGVFGRWQPLAYALGMVLGLFVMMNVLYLQNLIPPVPLAMRYGGVFHQVHQEGDAYVLRYEQPEWYQFWINSDEEFHYTEGEAVYCFVAVFAPTDLKKKIYHEWSFYDEDDEQWVATDRIAYEIEGLRSSGYRGYTFKRNIEPGAWRVDVETEDGLMVGRIRFQVERAEEPVTNLEQTRYR